MDMTILGIDIAKSVFQLHGIDADGAVVAQKKLRRGAVLNFLGKVGPCLIGMKACATSHYWAWLRVYVDRKRLGYGQHQNKPTSQSGGLGVIFFFFCEEALGWAH
jgi:hypothetical protein